MPLPDRGGQFPPAPFDKMLQSMRVWNAWYVGDQEELAGLYQSQNVTENQPRQGGIVGKLSRFFWGRPNQQASNRLHIPAPADLARSSAELLFAEPPTFQATEDNTRTDVKEAQKRLDKILNSEAAVSKFLEGAELCSALGGAYLRLWWDGEQAEHVQFGVVPGDAAVPTWKYDQLEAVTFWRVVLDKKNTTMRHLERHEKGRIYHGLYRGDSTDLGSPIPLTESPETAWAADLVDEEGGIDTGVDGLTAAYVPNVRPNRKWRNTPRLSPLGRSDFDGLENTFDALDSAYSSWMRDVDLGKSRLFVDSTQLENKRPGAGASWDGEQEIFTKVPTTGMGRADAVAGPLVQANQFPIRWSEHANTCAELLNVILRNAGLSPAQFTGDSTLAVGVPTATEVNSRENLSERTRKKKIALWKEALAPFATTAMELDAMVFETGIEMTESPNIRFPVRSTVDPVTQAGVIASLSAAGAISTEQMVKERNPNWKQEEVDEEVARINAEAKLKANFYQDPTPAGATDPSDSTSGEGAVPGTDPAEYE